MFCKKSRFLPEPKRFLIRSFFLSVGSAGSNIVKLHFDAEIRSSHRVWRPRSSVLSLQGLNFIVIWLWFLVHLRNCIFFCCCYRSGNVRVLTAFAWLFYLYTSFMFCPGTCGLAWVSRLWSWAMNLQLDVGWCWLEQELQRHYWLASVDCSLGELDQREKKQLLETINFNFRTMIVARE